MVVQPWGKHNPFRFHLNHTVKDFNNDKHNPKLEEYLPATTIRDPYSWMSSICRNPYTIHWPHNKKKCPNFPLKGTKNEEFYVKFGASKWPVLYDNLADMWNVWNGEYYNETQLPTLMVRFEDIVFHPKEVTKQVCECVGGGKVLFDDS